MNNSALPSKANNLQSILKEQYHILHNKYTSNLYRLEQIRSVYSVILFIQNLKNNLNINIKTEPVMDGVDAAVDVWFICPTTIRKTVISALSMTGSIF